jgi:hypothetical protein
VAVCAGLSVSNPINEFDDRTTAGGPAVAPAAANRSMLTAAAAAVGARTDLANIRRSGYPTVSWISGRRPT